LLFSDAWGSPERRVLDEIKQELGALSAALLVVSDDALLYLNAAPRETPSALPRALSTDALAALRRAYGGSRRRPGGLTLSVVESDGRERFRISRSLRGSVSAALLDALQIARQSVSLPASFRTFSERELLFYSLVGALSLVLSENGGTAEAAPHAFVARASGLRRPQASRRWGSGATGNDSDLPGMDSALRMVSSMRSARAMRAGESASCGCSSAKEAKRSVSRA
jgi:hypothetical protein